MMRSSILVIVCAAGIGSCGGSDGAGPKVPVPSRFVQIVGGRDQQDTIGATLATPIRILLVDSASRPRAGAVVRISAIPIQNHALPALTNPIVVTTGPDGTATTTVTLGAVTGSFQIEAREVYDNTADTARFTVLPGNPVHVGASPADSALYVGNHYQPLITVTDRGGNPRTDPVEYAVDSAGSVAAVSPSGVLSGVDVGRARVHLKVTGWPVTGSVRVSVVPRGTLAVAMGDYALSFGVAVVGVDGSQFKQLTTASGGSYLFPSWNADGTKIGYNSPDITRLFQVDLNGAVTPFVHANVMSSESWPRYSADGKYVYYTGGAYPDNLDTYRLPVDGSGVPERVTPPRPGSTRYWKASPSRDGTLLAYSEAGFAVHVLSLGTGIDRVVSDQLDGWGEAPRFSPDGNWIAYSDESNHVLHLVHPDGTGHRRLAAPGQWVNDWGHDWSPDGEWIVFRAVSGLWIIRVADDLLIPLPYAGNMNFPAWRPVP